MGFSIFYDSLNQMDITVRTIVKLLIVFSVAINPIALLADGLQITAVPAALSVSTTRHPGDAPRHQADCAALVSAHCKLHCCGDGMRVLQKVHSCALHHHPAFVANDSSFHSMAAPHPETFGLNVRMSSHATQPETPPPKYF